MKGVKTNQKDLINVYGDTYWSKSYLKLHNLRNILTMIYDGYDSEEIEEEMNINFKKNKGLKKIIYGIFSKSYDYKDGEKVFDKSYVKKCLRFINKYIEDGIKESKDDLTNNEIWGLNSYLAIFFLTVENP